MTNTDKYPVSSDLSQRQIHYFGSISPKIEAVKLKAGPLSLYYENGLIRNICYGSKELISRVYVAVRDKAWITIPNQIRANKIDCNNNGFSISFDVRNRNKEIDFQWHGTITGTSDAKIDFVLVGKALRPFGYNRICILVHYPHDAAGSNIKYQCKGSAETVDSILPDTVSPHSPVSHFSRISYQANTGQLAHLDFHNQECEMEDHRNFGDAGFKIFSPPLNKPFPVQMSKNEKLRQKVTLWIDKRKIETVKDDHSISLITIREPTLWKLVRYGFSVDDVVTYPEIDISESLIKRLSPSHFRVALDIDNPEWVVRIQKTEKLSIRFNTPYWVAIRAMSDQLPQRLSFVLSQLKIPPERIIISKKKKPANTTPELINNLRKQLKQAELETLIGGGTDHNFVFLNRSPPPINMIDFLSWSANPQQHNCDDTTIIENLIAPQSAAQSAKHIGLSLPIVLSPVTLRPRWNINAPDDPQPIDEDGFPRDVDPKQWGMFGAVWTLMSVKYLSECEIDDATYYELTGPKGLIYRKAVFSQPAFDDTPNAIIYPLFHVFKELSRNRNAAIVDLSASRPNVVNGLALQTKIGIILLLANLTSFNQKVEMDIQDYIFSGARVMSEKYWNTLVSDIEYKFEKFDFKQDVDSGMIKFMIPPFSIIKFV